VSKEIAQTVGGKRIAWLFAIVAAFVVFATVGFQFTRAFAATDPSVSASSQTASANVIDHGIGIEVATASYAAVSGSSLAVLQTPKSVEVAVVSGSQTTSFSMPVRQAENASKVAVEAAAPYSQITDLGVVSAVRDMLAQNDPVAWAMLPLVVLGLIVFFSVTYVVLRNRTNGPSSPSTRKWGIRKRAEVPMPQAISNSGYLL